MAVGWNKDADAALAEAKAQNKPMLIDFKKKKGSKGEKGSKKKKRGQVRS